jgi:ribulose 1,5-bisphosphate synthetase/thiazole synthase
MNDHYPVAQEPVIIVGAGPAGCATALLLADFGIPSAWPPRPAWPCCSSAR